MNILNRKKQRFKEVGLMTINDVVEQVYLAWLNDGSHWINKDKTGVFINAANPKGQLLADEVAARAMKGFGFNGQIVCRRKYNPHRLMTLRRVVVCNKNHEQNYYL